MKRILVFGLCLLMVMSLMTGCSSKENSEPESTASETSQQSELSTTQTTESTSESTEMTESKETTKETVTKPVEGLSNKYVDFDNRSFAVNGKVYTLGVDTLQDMIDDGVPFDENDIANANNNLNPNYESSDFEIVLDKYYSALIYVANYTSENASMADCVLSKIYLPVKQDVEQNILQFSFPLTLTEKALIAQAGEPTNRSDYNSDDSDYESHTLDYDKDCEEYLGNSGFSFKFVNGKLDNVIIDWKP